MVVPGRIPPFFIALVPALFVAYLFSRLHPLLSVIALLFALPFVILTTRMKYVYAYEIALMLATSLRLRGDFYCKLTSSYKDGKLTQHVEVLT